MTKEIKFKTLNYFSYGSEKFPGVINKINNTVKAAEKLNIKSNHKSYTSTSILK